MAPPRWRRRRLASLLSPSAGTGTGELAQAIRALLQDDAAGAHQALAAHFASRRSAFPLDPRTLDALASRIARRFPAAGTEASRRADGMLAGRYDMLGYRDVAFGHPPAWQRDPVHDRQMPAGYWSAVPYLEAESGDHKIIWEINRHQHWLGLGRAYQLTRERRYYAGFVDQLEDWLPNNPPLQGTNWASMLEVAFRSLSWVWALHFFAGAAREDQPGDAPWIVDLLLGLDRQLLHVAHNLSTYFSPNTHLSGEALGLYVAGCALPELKSSVQLKALGRRILVEQIDRQIKADGGHAELSAHYHRYSTDFYLLATQVARRSGDTAAGALEHAALRQAKYLRTIADDNGILPLIGDDDGGQLFPICGRRAADCRDTLAAASVILQVPELAVSEIPEEVYWQCGAFPLEELPRRAAPWPSAALPESGYFVSRTAQGDHLVFDAGRHGFLNGGHAHADALAIALTVAGRQLLVDSGTATYTMDAALRDRFRTTAMHNTVVLNGRPQSEPRGPFHWQAVADARPLVWRSAPGFDYAEGMHDGYRPAIHARGVLALHGLGWVVIDHFLGPAGPAAKAEAFWHVAPAWRAIQDGTSVMLSHLDGIVCTLASSSALQVLAPEEANGLDSYAPEYGRVEPAICLRDRSEGPFPRSVATFISCAADIADPVTIAATPVTSSAGASWHSAAFRLSWKDREAIILTAIELSPGDEAGGNPGQLWGCDEARTDARVAFVEVGSATGVVPILIGGTEVRVPLAPSVQESLVTGR
ncbi:MAG: alginate lyase family protein [Acidobacteriota bacterium]